MWSLNVTVEQGHLSTWARNGGGAEGGGQLPIRSAGQRCLCEKVAAELSLQHGWAEFLTAEMDLRWCRQQAAGSRQR